MPPASNRNAASPDHPQNLKVRSMTGFGSAEATDDQYEIQIEIRGLNHRHLQWKARFPSYLHALEAEADSRIRRCVQRGSLHVGVDCQSFGLGPQACFHEEIAQTYLQDLRVLAKKLGLKSEPSLEMILGLPGVTESTQTEPTVDLVRSLFQDALDSALASFIASREREGEAMAADIRTRVQTLCEELEGIESHLPNVIDKYRERLTQKIVGFLAEHGHAIDDVDVLREVAIYADRSDVMEELTRMRAHLDELDRLLGQGGPIGRALDFLCQEMLRETNTIGSKSMDAELAHRVVSIKTELERIKEQVQNLE